jgi:hypothetical protein
MRDWRIEGSLGWTRSSSHGHTSDAKEVLKSNNQPLPENSAAQKSAKRSCEYANIRRSASIYSKTRGITIDRPQALLKFSNTRLMIVDQQYHRLLE